MASPEVVDANLAALLRAWVADVDSEPFPVFPAPAAVAVRKDYGPAGACAPKAALLLLAPVALVRLVWKLVRR
jgi:hypothetical protein